jgi:hypothetical protein
MRCPHLIKWLTFVCKAKDEFYFPSAFQLQEYCKRKEHRKCPLNLQNIHTEDETDNIYPVTNL